VPPNLPGLLARRGQEPLNPPTVKGWDGGPTWVNTSTMLARFNFVNALVANAKTLIPNVDPNALVAAAGGFDAQRIVDRLVAQTLQDDVTSDVRATLVAYLNGTSAASQSQTPNALPFGQENYQEKLRGVVALTLNLPVNQLN
jgi:hypothetical protein